MAKYIKYKMNHPINIGTVDEPNYQDRLYDVKLSYSERNLIVAQAEAYNGQYTIQDDGQTSEPTAQDDTDAMIIDHEYRITLLELGLIE